MGKKRMPRKKQEIVEVEPSYLTYNLKTNLSYYILSMKSKYSFLEWFKKNNTHSKVSEAEFISRTESDIKHLERHLLRVTASFVSADPKRIPKWLVNGTLNHFFSSDIVNGYKTNDISSDEVSYLMGWEISLDDTVAAILVGHPVLKDLIYKELESGNTVINVVI